MRPVPIVRSDIVSPDDLAERTLQLYDRGLPRGDSSGWADVDQYYTVAPKQWTLITGIPGSGKSEWLDALCVNLAQSNDWEFAIYSPENYPTEVHMAKLLEKHLNKPFGAGPTERMTRAEVDDHMTWVVDHFFWMDPEYKGIDQLLAVSQTYRRPNRRKFGLILDPWNTIEHQRPRELTETEYISKTLGVLTNWCRARDMHIFLVAHPQKMMRDKDGNRPVPSPYDVAGSAHFYNKPDNILAIHRDQAEMNQRVEIHVQKVRFKNIGHVGLAELSYDRVTGRYNRAAANFTTQRQMDIPQ